MTIGLTPLNMSSKVPFSMAVFGQHKVIDMKPRLTIRKIVSTANEFIIPTHCIYQQKQMKPSILKQAKSQLNKAVNYTRQYAGHDSQQSYNQLVWDPSWLPQHQTTDQHWLCLFSFNGIDPCTILSFYPLGCWSVYSLASLVLISTGLNLPIPFTTRFHSQNNRIWWSFGITQGKIVIPSSR